MNLKPLFDQKTVKVLVCTLRTSLRHKNRGANNPLFTFGELFNTAGVIFCLLANVLIDSEAFALEGARLLPKGKSQVGIETKWTSSSTYFGADGQRGKLGESYRKRIALHAMRPYVTGLSLNEREKILLQKGGAFEKVELNFNVERSAFEISPSWFHGLYTNWSIGIRVPLVYSSAKIRPEFAIEVPATEIDAEKKAQYRQLESKLNNERFQLADQILADENFNSLTPSGGDFYLGDIAVINRWGLYDNSVNRLAVQSVLEFPGVEGAERAEYIEGSMIDGQIDMSLGLLWDLRILARLGFECGVKYVHQFQDEVLATVNEQGLDQDDNVESGKLRTRRKLGNKIEGHVLSWIVLSSRWKVSGGYRYSYKGRDKYEDSNFNKGARGQKQSTGHFADVGMSYRFAGAPMDSVEAQLHWSQMVMGRNIDQRSETSLNFNIPY